MEFGSFVLAASTVDLAVEPEVRRHADAVELRLDLADEPLDQLARYDGALPIIATNRVHAEGGQAADDAARVDTLVAAVEHARVEAVDIELAALETGDGDRVVTAARVHDVSVIVSTHDFDGTPPVDDMRQTLQAAADAGDIGKLAVSAGDPGDVLDLLALTWSLASEGVTIATMAMGSVGRHSRAIVPLYGSRVGYAPADAADATAPGQYDLETLRRLVDALR